MKRMASRPYWHGLKQACEGMTREQLIGFILHLGGEITLEERAGFLYKLRSFAPLGPGTPPDHGPTTDGVAMEELLERLSSLKEVIEHRVASIEDGTYWDRNPYDPSQDEDPDAVTPEEAEALTTILVETDDLFVQGRFAEAGRLYEPLFDLLDAHPTVGYSLPAGDLNEVRARYCRALYESVDADRRLEALWEGLRVEAPERTYPFEAPCETRPLLKEVIASTTAPMSGLEALLPAWDKRLAELATHRATLLRLEAAEMLEGTAGVARLAREWQSRQPYAYLQWIAILEREEDFPAMREACAEALAHLPHGRHREKAADLLATAGVRLGDPGTALLGKREAFLSVPDEDNLVGFLREVGDRPARCRELSDLLEALAARDDSRRIQGNLRIKMQLMIGRLLDALEEGRHVAPLGWSGGQAGILFGAALTVLTHHADRAATIQGLLKDYTAGPALHFGPRGPERLRGSETLHREILVGLSTVNLSRGKCSGGR